MQLPSVLLWDGYCGVVCVLAFLWGVLSIPTSYILQKYGLFKPREIDFTVGVWQV